MAGLTVPTFAADGRKLRRYSIESILRLEQLKLVVVQRSKRGVVLTAHFYGETRMPLQARLSPGTRYSYRELLDSGRRHWSHSKLPRIPISPALSSSEYQQELHTHRAKAFAAVTLSVIAPKVVSIEVGRQRLAEKRAHVKTATVVPNGAKLAA